jgi:hypothetical protein
VTNLYGVFWIAAGANHFFNTPFYVCIMPPFCCDIWRSYISVV